MSNTNQALAYALMPVCSNVVAYVAKDIRSARAQAGGRNGGWEVVPLYKNEWTPLSRMLPPIDVNVMVYDEEMSEVVIAKRWSEEWAEPSDWAWQSDAAHRTPESVTHWMPLPEPPKVK